LPLILAHRGSHCFFRENTLTAFDHARRLGADGIELDVRLTADGVVVVHHDAAIAPLGPIGSLRAASLPEFVPTLEAAVASCGGLVLNVELKNSPDDPGYDRDGELADKVVACLSRQALGKPEGKGRSQAGRRTGSTLNGGQAHAGGLDATDFPSAVVVSSFDLPTLDAVRTRCAHLQTALVVSVLQDPAKTVDEAAEHGLSGVHPHESQVDGTWMQRAHGAGLSVRVWTVNQPARAVALAGLGVDGIITDRVPAIRAALGRSES